MFAAIGQWRMDPELDDERRNGAAEDRGRCRSVAWSRCGYWTDDAGGVSSRTFIVFDLASAEQFGSDVSGSAENQRRAGVENLSLVVEEVAAQTAGRGG